MRNYTRLRNRGRRVLAFGSAPAAAWTPASVSGLACWYTAGPTWCFTDAGGTVACGDGDPVRVWTDRSANARTLTQGTSANRPSLVLGGDGRWKVEFDGVNDYTSAAFQAGVPQTALCAYQSADGDGVVAGFSHPSLASRLAALYLNPAGTLDLLVQNSGNVLFIGGAASTLTAHAAAAVISGTDAAATGQLWVDGTSVAGPTAASGALDVTGYSFVMGLVLQSLGSPSNQDVMEYFCYDAALSDANRQAGEAYLKAAWNTP